MKRAISPEIERVVKQPTLSLYGEGRNVVFVKGREYEIASGVRTYGMLPKDPMRTREIRQSPRRNRVGSDKPTKQGWPDGLPEVGLADSTRT